jgi:uncharacterized protein YjbI with pentapeptide repeats
MDDSGRPESGAGEPKPPKIKAEDNPWYLLATLYGVPDLGDYDLQKKNRVVWNRYFAEKLGNERRPQLIEEKRHHASELKPFAPEELHEIKEAFAQRRKSLATTPALPPVDSFADFRNVQFDSRVIFEGYVFNTCFFQGAVFRDFATFRQTTFRIYADFNGADFCDASVFERATFHCQADFEGVTFSTRTLFHSATFFDVSTFKDATFEYVDFTDAIFYSFANFSSSTFRDLGRFVNAKMKETTSFERAMFKITPPEFFGAELHQGTIWRGITWPPTPKDKRAAGTFVDAYACLKLEMDRLKKHEDELKFFSLELRSLRILRESKFRGSGVPIALYGIICDYGRSYIRPLIGLFVVAAIGALILLPFRVLTPWQSLGLSFANTFNVFGFRKDFCDAETISKLSDPLKILSATQTILGTILLFLVGLGVRNRFRMK